MIVVLLSAGIFLALAGLVAIGFGIPINEFGFGNTLIVAGTVAACTGLLLVAFSAALRELQTIARRLGPGPGLELHGENPLQAATGEGRPHDPVTESSGLFGRDKPVLDSGKAEPPPWLGEAPPRDGAPDDGPPAPPADPAPAGKQRRNLLFSSSSRKERERTEARSNDPSITDFHPEPVAAPHIPESSEAAPASFDDAWPKPERSRTDLPRRAGRTPSTFAEAPPIVTDPDRAPPAARTVEPPQVTVLKSGVVDGMAYSLYSDGSIEAQMPEGMMRFASIDELRAHLDQRQ